MSKAKKGVLILNLGTPKSPKVWNVYRYLTEFLTDARVIDIPWIKRQLLVRGFIIPSRCRQSAELYRKLWTEEGSPLLFHGQKVEEKLQEALGPSYKVVLGMRYQEPSIPQIIETLKKEVLDEIIILPLFPQYASATTGSIHQKVMESLKNWTVIPKLTFINSFYDHPEFIEAFFMRAKDYDVEGMDHILFSFHGLPERQIRKTDQSGSCLSGECCKAMTSKNTHCYRAQCFATARAIARKLDLPESKYTVCFQSRLGKEPWLEPYTVDMLKVCVSKGYHKVLVFCPAFVCDCLETTIEISEEYGAEFKKLGGKSLQLVEGLNSHPAWIKALQKIILEL